jgi:hypothetical protein
MENRVPRHIHRVGVSRRELLQVGFLGAFGMWMSEAIDPLRALAHASTASGEVRSRAKSVILVWMPGGPPQMQLWDLKPDSPSQCRGTAQPIKTSAPGIQLGSRLPLTAKQAHHLALVRTITLNKEDENHIPGHQLLLAGIDERPATFKSFATRNDWPSIGSVVTALKPSSSGLPAAIHLPLRIKYEGAPVPGESAGWLGSKYDPWIVEQDPNAPDFHVHDLAPLPGLTVDRLGRRRELLAQVDSYRRDLDADLQVRQLSDAQQKAFGLATSEQTRRAFDLSQEPAALRERYGRHTWGQSLLLGRRLAQTGVKFVQVNIGGLNAWDYHRSEDASMDKMMPRFDQGFSALLEDLHQQGMLSETLVLCMSEMGRNPVLGKAVTGAAMNAAEPDGRNHWQWCWTGVFAGAGVRGGNVLGESDEWASYPNSEAYHPSDIGATIYQALGLDPRTEVRDIQGRPVIVNQGSVMEKLF